MSEGSDQRGGSVSRPSYFFLSYAHSPPLAGSPLAQPDEWVRTLFHDLTDAVQGYASQQYRIAPGFYDQEIPFGLDWKTALSRALGAAEVFVPLYSPGYIARSLPGREWSCFEGRMKAAGIAEPLRRFAPVLWIPLPADQRPRGLREARDLAPASASTAYVENGLLALLRLAPYRGVYELIVGRLAERIVELAEKMPIEPSPVPDIDRVPSAFATEARAVTFAVVVAAPASPAIPTASDGATNGGAGGAWRPFSREQVLPLAQYAAMVAEQFDFAVQVTEVEAVGDLLDHAPGIVLIDPRYLADGTRLNDFRDFVRDMPPWALPILISDPDQDAQATQLAQQVSHVLAKAKISRSRPVRYALRGVRRRQDFINLMPSLVAEAEREYLRRGPIQRFAAKPGSRRRLAGAGRSADHASPSSTEEKPAEEKPDA